MNRTLLIAAAIEADKQPKSSRKTPWWMLFLVAIFGGQ